MARSLAEILLDDKMPQFASVAMPFGTTLTGLDNWVSDHYQHCARAKVAPNAEVIVHDPDLTPEETKEYINQTFHTTYFYEKNKIADFQPDEDEYVATAKIFVSRNGSWLLQQYDALDPSTLDDKEFALFLEDNTGDLITSNVLRIKAGAALMPKILSNGNVDISGSKAVKTVLESGLFNRQYTLSVEQRQQLLELLNDTESTLEYIVRLFLEATEMVADEFYSLMIDVCEYTSNWLFANARIDEKTWNTRFGESLTQGFFESILLQMDETTKGLENLKNSSLLLKSQTAATAIDYLIRAIGAWREVVKQIQEATAEIFAMVCGIWNGLIDLIGGIFQLIALLLKAIKASINLAFNAQISADIITEFLDDVLQACHKINWNEVLVNAIVGYAKLKDYLDNKLPRAVWEKLKSLNTTEWNYYSGYALFELIQLLIPELELAKLAKLAKLGKLERVYEALESGVRRGLKRVFEKGEPKPELAVASFTAYLSEFLTLLRAGTKPLSERVAKIFDDIIAWLDELVGANKAAMEKELAESKDFLNRRKGKYGKKEHRYTRNQLKLLVRDLKERYKGINLQIEIVSDNPAFRLRRKRWAKDGTVGSFSKGPPPTIFLEQNCSELTLQHELWHLDDYIRLGADEYARIPNWLHEQSVWEKIWASRERWTDKELIDSYNYYRKITRESGESGIVNNEIKELILKLSS
jgi:hypothetical protein